MYSKREIINEVQASGDNEDKLLQVLWSPTVQNARCVVHLYAEGQDDSDASIIRQQDGFVTATFDGTYAVVTNNTFGGGEGNWSADVANGGYIGAPDNDLNLLALFGHGGYTVNWRFRVVIEEFTD